MANTYIPDRWLDKLESLPAKDYKILLSAIFRGEDEPEISAKHQHIADEIYTDVNKKNYHKKVVNKSRLKIGCDSAARSQISHSDSSKKSQLYHGDVSVTSEEKKEKDSPPSPPSSSPPHPLNNTPYNPPLEREKREDSPSSLTLTNPPGGDIESERAENPPKVSLSERFDKLWELYPRKMGKKKAYDAYLRAIKQGVTDAVIKDGIARYNAYLTAEKVNMQYVKLGSTWFVGQCWSDEYNVNINIHESPETKNNYDYIAESSFNTDDFYNAALGRSYGGDIP
ncbi:MAG: hypothetical protein ACI4EU_05120 [Butyrivibrio sp.]